MDIDTPGDLLRLFFEYRLQTVPVTHEGRVESCIEKDDLVQYLRSSDHFRSPVPRVLADLAQPHNDSLLDELEQQLREGEIRAIPILDREGEILRLVTPGLLGSRDASGELIDQADQVELYETLMRRFPFPLQVRTEHGSVFENEAWRRDDEELDRVELLRIEEGDWELRLRVPHAVKRLTDAFERLNQGESFPIRDVLADVEHQLLNRARSLSDSVAAAARRVELPRQTFSYRWNENTDRSSP